MISNRKFARSSVSVNSTSTKAHLDNMSCAGKSGTTSKVTIFGLSAIPLIIPAEYGRALMRTKSWVRKIAVLPTIKLFGKRL